MAYFDLNKLNLTKSKVLKALEILTAMVME